MDIEGGDGGRDFMSQPDPLSPSGGFDAYYQPEYAFHGGRGSYSQPDHLVGGSSSISAPRTGIDALDLNSAHGLPAIRVRLATWNQFCAPRTSGDGRGRGGRGGGRPRSLTLGAGSGQGHLPGIRVGRGASTAGGTDLGGDRAGCGSGRGDNFHGGDGFNWAEEAEDDDGGSGRGDNFHGGDGFNWAEEAEDDDDDIEEDVIRIMTSLLQKWVVENVQTHQLLNSLGSSEESLNQKLKEDMKRCLNLAVECGAAPDSVEYFVATVLFREVENRIIFRTIPNNAARLTYLKRWARVKKLD